MYVDHLFTDIICSRQLFASFFRGFYNKIDLNNVSGVHYRKLGQNYTVKKKSHYPSNNINHGSPLFSSIKNIPCSDCNICYVGETKKQLQDRVKQHKADSETLNAL